MSRSSYCPNCGAALGGEYAAVGVRDDRSGDGGYDTSCRACGWSGDIVPDDEQGAAGEGVAEGRKTEEERDTERLREMGLDAGRIPDEDLPEGCIRVTFFWNPEVLPEAGDGSGGSPDEGGTL